MNFSMITLALLSAVQSVAIKSASQTASEIELEPSVDEVGQPEGQLEGELEEMPIPDWLNEFVDYLEAEEETDFDLDAFLEKRGVDEIEDFFYFLNLMIAEEMKETEKMDNN